MAQIRPYVPADAPDLARLHQASFPANAISASALNRRLRQVMRSGGWAWSIHATNRLVGYAFVTLVPGLDGVTELNGCIDPLTRRRGLGSQLLAHILAALPRPQVRQLSYPTDRMDSPAALFLQHRGFSVEHVEWLMECRLEPDYPPPAVWPAGYEVRQFRQAAAIAHFRRLYQAIFAGHPWYQPYTSSREVAGELDNPADLQFLFHHEVPVGLAWLRWPEPAAAEIEPFGLVPAYQSQGHGRRFLESILYRLAGQSVRQVHMGVWQNNRPAVNLYRRVGFQHRGTRTYLAIDL